MSRQNSDNHPVRGMLAKTMGMSLLQGCLNISTHDLNGNLLFFFQLKFRKGSHRHSIVPAMQIAMRVVPVVGAYHFYPASNGEQRLYLPAVLALLSEIQKKTV